MSASQICIIATIVVYLVAMVLVGVYCSRKGAGGSSHEFYLGGRKLGPVVTAMSAEASDMSSYLLMGLPGLAYLCGVAEVGWTAIGLAIGTYLNWLIVAKRLRRYSAHIGAITVPSFFSRRYRDEKYVLSCIAAVVILIFFIPYTASGFKAIGTLFNSLFGVNYHVAMIVGAIVVIGYTVLGGFLAVSTTDLIQSIVMTFALVFIVFFGISQAGGWESVTANATSMPGYLNLTQGYDAATNQAGSFPALSIVSTLAWGLGYFGMPHILLRFMAIEDDTKLKTSRRIATVWVVISMFIAVLIGIVGNTVTKEGKIPFLGTSSDAETILIKLSDLLSQHGVLRTGGRSGPVRHPGLHHVHRRLPAAGRCLQCVSRPGAGLLRQEAQPQELHAGRPRHRHRHRRCGYPAGLEPQQLRVPHRVLRLGRFRRGLRPAGPLLPVLEADHEAGRHRRHGRRRRDGLHLEVPAGPHGRRLEHLRAAARLPRGLRRHRRCLPGHPRPCQGDRGGIRGCG